MAVLTLRATIGRDRNGNRTVTVIAPNAGHRLNGKKIPCRLHRQVEGVETNEDAAENATVELLGDRILFTPDYIRRGLHVSEGPEVTGKMVGVNAFWFIFQD